MPDIKSALTAALFRPPVATVLNQTLKEWDDEGETHFPINNPSVPVQTKTSHKIKNNVMRETFAFIKAHPGLKGPEIGEHMERRGFKSKSTTSVASQLVREGQAERVDGRYYILANEYSPIKQTSTSKITQLRRRVEELKVVAKGKGIADLPVQAPAQGLAALAAPVAHTAPTPEEPPKPKRFAMLTTPQTPEQIVKGMTAYQARELYEHLKQLFGG
jgi:hypothetical protein